MTDHEHAMLEAINAARVSRGLHALRHDDRLSNAAYDHAVDLSRHPGMLHEGSDGSTILERILRAGYNASWHYEVVGWGWQIGKPVYIISEPGGALEANRLEVRPRKTSREQSSDRTKSDTGGRGE